MQERSEKVDLKKKVWSFSSIKCYQQCPYAFYLRYVLGQPEESNCFSQAGSLVHDLLDKAYKGELFPFELADEFEKRWQDLDLRFPFFAMSKAYHDKSLEYLSEFDFDDRYEVVSSEYEIRLKIGKYEFTGFVDLILRDKADGKLIIQDHKSKSKMTKNEQCEYAKQLYLYAFALHELGYEYPKTLRFNLYRSRKEIDIPFCEDDMHEAVAWFTDSVGKILAENDWDCKTDEWFCSKLCGADCIYRGE